MVLCLVEIDEAANKQIRTVIVAIVEPERAGSPSRSGYSSLLRQVGQCAFPIVPVPNVRQDCVT